MRKILISAIMGVLALLLVNLTAPLSGVALAVNIYTLSISSFLGIGGVILMIALAYLI